MKHKFIILPLLCAGLSTNVICLATSCKNNDDDSDTIKITSDYHLVVHAQEKDYSYAHQINEALKYYCGYELPFDIGSVPSTNHEIIFDMSRQECKDLLPKLGEDKYIIKEDNGKIIIAWKSHMARMCAVDHLLTKYASNKGIIIPKGLEVIGHCNANNIVTEIDLPEDPSNEYRNIRDAYMVKEDDGYYLFGTTGWAGTDWRYYKHANTGSLTTDWVNGGKIAELSGNLPDIYDDPGHDPQRWAPEIHKYKDKWYMFTTYHSRCSDQRGVTIFRSDNLIGEYVPISSNKKNLERGAEWTNNKHITDDYATVDPSGQKAGHTIDGTLYVDPQGQPWLVYVNEWVAQSDRVGRFSAVKFTNDNLEQIDESTNKELFRADDAPWAPEGNEVTDGCFIHTMPSGRLIMTWSSNNGNGYSVGFSTSDHGILGPWEHHKQQLYAAGMYRTSNVGGGHCMFYEDNGQLYMCMHGEASDGHPAEHPVIVPVKETPYDTIAWDLYHE